MNKSLFVASALAVAIAFSATPGAAAVQRTAVALSGLDTNPCSVAQPCRTFAAALAQTLPGGQVLVQDSAGYGSFTITQAVTIVSPPGTVAFITASASGATGITINAGPNDNVILAGFFIEGAGTGSTGIQINSTGKGVAVSRTTITNFTGNGISDMRSNASGSMTLTDVSIYSNGGDGVHVQPAVTAGYAFNAVNSFFSGNPVVIDTSSATSPNLSAAFENCVFRYGPTTPTPLLTLNATGTPQTLVQIDRSMLYSNSLGLAANGVKGTIALGASSASSIGTLVNITNGGIIASYKNNNIAAGGLTGLTNWGPQ